MIVKYQNIASGYESTSFFAILPFSVLLLLYLLIFNILSFYSFYVTDLFVIDMDQQG